MTAPHAQALHGRGLRATPARLSVLEALESAHHGSVESIFDHIAAVVPGLNLSTVYRTVETLEQAGLVSHTHVAGGATTYQLRDQATHAHLVCRTCQGVTEMPVELSTEFGQHLHDSTGFTVDMGHLSVFGTCAACAGGAVGTARAAHAHAH